MYKRLVLFAFSLTVPALAGAADFHYGLIGITPIETIRLAAFCLNEGPQAGTPCVVEFHFHDRAGRILKQAAMTLQPDTGGFLDFRLADARLTGKRVEVEPCYRVSSGAATSNLQVFDNFTTRTHLFRNWSDQPVPTGGEVHFGSTGLIAFDTARVNAFCPSDPSRTTPSSPCDVTFIFHDNQGRILKQTAVTLQPDTGAFLDFRTAEAGLPARRVEITPCVRVGRGAAVATLEVFDTFTGFGNVFAHAAATLTP